MNDHITVPLYDRHGNHLGDALFSPEDRELAERHDWRLNKQIGYVVADTAPAGQRGRGNNDYAHRLVLGLTRGDGKIADHINRNRLDNRRENLRVVTASESQFNRAPYTTKTWQWWEADDLHHYYLSGEAMTDVAVWCSHRTIGACRERLRRDGISGARQVTR